MGYVVMVLAGVTANGTKDMAARALMYGARPADGWELGSPIRRVNAVAVGDLGGELAFGQFFERL